MGNYLSAEHRAPLFEKAVREVTGPLFDRAVLNDDVSNAYEHLVRAAQHGNPNLETMGQQLLELVNQMLKHSEGRAEADKYLTTLKENIENGTYNPADMSAYALGNPTVATDAETQIATGEYPTTDRNDLLVSEVMKPQSRIENTRAAIEEVAFNTFKHGLTKNLDDFVVMCYFNLQKARDLGMPEYNDMRMEFLDEIARKLMDRNLDEKDVQLLGVMKKEFEQ